MVSPTVTFIVRFVRNVLPPVCAVTITPLTSCSATLAGLAVSVMSAVSLSVSVSVASSAGFEPGMLTLIVSSPSITVSSVGVRVKVPLTLVCPALSTSVKFFTAAKSVPDAAVPLLTLNSTSTDSDNFTPPVVIVTVTEVAPAPSETFVGLTVRVEESTSLSSTCPLAGDTVVPVALPLTVKVSVGSRKLSRLAVVVNVAVPLVWPLLMVMSKPVTEV